MTVTSALQAYCVPRTAAAAAAAAIIVNVIFSISR